MKKPIAIQSNFHKIQFYDVEKSDFLRFELMVLI